MNHALVKFLIKLRNASLNKKGTMTFKNIHNLKVYAEALYKRGLIQSFSFQEDSLVINLRYFEDRALTNNLTLLSTPSRVRSLTYLDLLQTNLKCKYFFLSTSKGILCHRECLKRKIGGIAIFAC